MRPTSRPQMPAQLTTTSPRRRPARCDAGHPPVRRGDPGDLHALDDPGAAAARAPGQRQGGVDGLVWPSPGMKIAPTTRRMSISGWRAPTSAGPSTRARGRRWPIEAARRSSSRRSAVRARQAAVRRKPVGWPVSALEPGVELGRVLGRAGSGSGRAQLPIRPAACQVVPQVSCRARAAGRPASRAGQVVGDAPPTMPPPMITTRAWEGSRARATGARVALILAWGSSRADLASRGRASSARRSTGTLPACRGSS